MPVLEQVTQWSNRRWCNKNRYVYEVNGDKYMCLTYYVHLFRMTTR